MWNTLIQTARREIVQHASWMLLGQVLVSLSAFILTYALANAVSKEVAGSFRYVTSAYAVATSFAFYGIGTALSKAVAQGKTGTRKRAYRYKFWVGCVVSVVLIGVALYTYLQNSDLPVFVSLVIAAVVLPATEMYSLYNFSLQGASLFRESSLYMGAGRLITNIAVVAVAYKVPSLVPLVIVYFVISLAYSYFAHTKSLRLIADEGEEDTEIISYAMHLSFAGLIGGVVVQVHTFILYGFFGSAILATYWIAGIIPQEIARVVSMVSTVMFPRLAKGDVATAFRGIRSTWWVMFFGIAAVSLAYAIVSPIVFKLFFPAYKDAVGLSILLLFAYSFVPYLFLGQWLVARGFIRGVYILNLIDPLSLLLFYVLLIPPFGVYGVAYANILKNVLINTGAFLFAYRNPWMVRLLER